MRDGLGKPVANTHAACCKTSVRAAALVATRNRVTREAGKPLRRAVASYQLTAASAVPNVRPLPKRYFWNASAACINSVTNAAGMRESSAARTLVASPSPDGVPEKCFTCSRAPSAEALRDAAPSATARSTDGGLSNAAPLSRPTATVIAALFIAFSASIVLKREVDSGHF